jgi:acetyltransferase
MYRKEPADRSARQRFQALFHPRSIAVIGASANPLKPGGRLIRNLLQNSYAGALWAVNPGAPVPGVATVASVAELPAAPELALIAIPAPKVRTALEALARKGARAAIVMSAGFGEMNAAGRAEERRLLAIAEAAGMTVIGPNCSGFLTTTYAGKFAGILTRPLPARIDLVCGSGAVMDFIVEQATERGLIFSSTVNVGNSVQVGIEDILGLLDLNFGARSARLILLYMERIRTPERLLRHARSLTAKGCLLVGIKSGTTAAGARAALSHTGALSTPERAVQALFEKAGIIRVASKAEMIDLACVHAAAGGPVAGGRAFVVTSAGGPGVMLADELSRQGYKLPQPRRRTRERLRRVLPPEATLANPLDCLPSKDGPKTRRILEIVGAGEKRRLDVILTIDGASGLVDEGGIFLETLAAARKGPVPIIPVISSATTSAARLASLRAAGGVYLTDEVSAGRALGRLLHRPRLFSPVVRMAGFDRRAVRRAAAGWAGPAAGTAALAALLRAAGFRLPPQALVRTLAGLDRACRQIGFPLALKAAGILHKTDVGGVRLGISTRRGAARAFAELAAIPGVDGVLVQKMVAGPEVILGAVREEGFGHLVMAGLGGIYAEALDAAVFALAPLSAAEALARLRRLPGRGVIEGVRGTAGVSLAAVAELMARVSLLTRALPAVAEIDLNPVKGTGEDLSVVDARLILRP